MTSGNYPNANYQYRYGLYSQEATPHRHDKTRQDTHIKNQTKPNSIAISPKQRPDPSNPTSHIHYPSPPPHKQTNLFISLVPLNDKYVRGDIYLDISTSCIKYPIIKARLWFSGKIHRCHLSLLNSRRVRNNFDGPRVRFPANAFILFFEEFEGEREGKGRGGEEWIGLSFLVSKLFFFLLFPF